MPNDDTYDWIGGTAGAWGVAANWEDLTLGTVAATAPVAGGTVTIGAGVTLTGTGSADSLTLQGADTVLGDINAGTLLTNGDLTIGTGGTISAGAGTLLGNVTDNGLLSAQSLQLGLPGVVSPTPGPYGAAYYATLPTAFGFAGSGTLEVDEGGSVLAVDGISGGVTVQLDGDATLDTDGAIAAGDTVNLDNHWNTIVLDDPIPSSPPAALAATVNGYDSSDPLYAIGDASFGPVWANGTLTLGTFYSESFGGPIGSPPHTSGTVDAFPLVGNYGSYAFGLTRAVGGREVTSAAPPGTDSDSYLWVGPAIYSPLSGPNQNDAWSTAANWQDTTTGTLAAAPPGSNAVVSIGSVAYFSSITGTGAAASLTFTEPAFFDANVTTGTLTVETGADVALGGTIVATAATIEAGGSLNVADLTVTGFLDGIGSTAVDGILTLRGTDAGISGTIQAGSVVLDGAQWYFPVTDDAIEVGNANDAANDTLTIDAGHTLTGTGGLIETNYNISYYPAYGTIVNNGLIASGSLNIGEVQEYYWSNGQPGLQARGATTWGPNAVLSGYGTVEVQQSGTINLTADVRGPGTSFLIDGSASLSTFGSIDPGNTITFNGSGGSLILNGESVLPTVQNQDDSYIGSVGGQAPGPFEPNAPDIAAAIGGFDATDEIIFQGFTFKTASYAGGTLDLLYGTTIADTLTLSGDYVGDTFNVATGTVAGLPWEFVTLAPQGQNVTIACFAAGTHIETPSGPVPVEQLTEGGLVATVSGAATPVQWIGRRTIDCRRHPDPDRVRPVRIAPHAFGHGRPLRAVLLSPDHAVFVEDVLIPVKFLLNGLTVTQRKAARVTYYHLELPRHDVVLAEGLPVESYLETGGRSAFENGGGPVQLHPDFAGTDPARVGMVWQNFAYAPLIGSAGKVELVRARMMWQAAMLGYLDGGPTRAARPPSRHPRA